MRGSLLIGIAIGAGAALFGPGLWRSGRPAIKQAVRAGLEGYGQARVTAMRMAEEIEDLVAEVTHEMQDLVVEATTVAHHTIHPGDSKGRDKSVQADA